MLDWLKLKNRSLTMANTKKGKVMGSRKGKGASNRGGSSSSGSARVGGESAADGGRENEDVVMDAEEDVGVDEETRLLEEEVERMRERLRSRRGSMSGTRDSQEQRDRCAMVRRTDGGAERRVVLERSRIKISSYEEQTEVKAARERGRVGGNEEAGGEVSLEGNTVVEQQEVEA